jgi:hypothetical protein
VFAEPRLPQVPASAHRLHLQALKRGLVARHAAISKRIHTSTLARRAADWLFPWDVETYPGIVRGFLEVLGRRISWAAVQHWQAERRPIPPWARAVLADYIEARCRAGLELVAELRTEPGKAGNRATPNEGAAE